MEKEFLDVFLRRCIFYYIEFFDRDMMEEIVKVYFDKVEEYLLE